MFGIEVLQERMIAVVRNHPELLQSVNIWDVYNYPEFNVDDLQPSLAQASLAFENAQKVVQDEKNQVHS